MENKNSTTEKTPSFKELMENDLLREEYGEKGCCAIAIALIVIGVCLLAFGITLAILA